MVGKPSSGGSGLSTHSAPIEIKRPFLRQPLQVNLLAIQDFMVIERNSVHVESTEGGVHNRMRTVC